MVMHSKTHTLCFILSLQPVLDSLSPSTLETLNEHRISLALIIELMFMALSLHKTGYNRYPEIEHVEYGRLLLLFEEFATEHMNHAEIEQPTYIKSWKTQKEPLEISLIGVMISVFSLVDGYFSEFGIEIIDPHYSVNCVMTLPNNTLVVNSKTNDYPV